jgi:hypothetical protein
LSTRFGPESSAEWTVNDGILSLIRTWGMGV